METRANYVLIGAFTLAGIVLGLAFFVWLAKIQIDRQYAYYDVLFDERLGPQPGGGRALQRPFGRTGGLARPRRRGVRAGARPDRGRGRHADPRGRDRPAAGAGRDRGVARLAVGGRPVEAAAARLGRRRGSGDPGRAIGRAVADRGRARPARRIDQAGEGVPEHRRDREPGAGDRDPRQRRDRLGGVRDRPDRLLVDLAVGRRGDRADLGLHRQAAADRRTRSKAPSARPRRP